MSPEPYRLHDSLGYRLSVASRQQERRLDEGLRRIGLTRTTWCILLAVENEGRTQPSEIAEFVGIDRTGTSRALRQMEQAGLIDRDAGTGDRRTRRVTLTDAGRAAIAAGTPLARANAEVLAGRLSPEDHAELKRLLETLIRADDRNLAHL